MTTMPCPHCHGQGYSMKLCKRCNGEKRISAKKHISLKIPQGADDGLRLRLKGMGECGVCGGSNGNLYVNVLVESSSLFGRNKLDVNANVPISPIVAALGGTVEVPSPYGYCKVKVPAGTKTGDTAAIHGKGLKSDNGVGNLNVRFAVDTLSKLDKSQKNFLEELQKTLSDDNLEAVKRYKKEVSEYYA